MARQTRRKKPLIFVFCEGESELAYTRFLKERFSDCVVLRGVGPFPTNLFQEAKSRFEKSPNFRDKAVEVTDEIWFFFDVDNADAAKWDGIIKIIKQLRRLRKKPGIRVRLLMTTACVEYWLLLHYRAFTPPICTTADKEKMLHELQKIVPAYEKGDVASTLEIAEKYETAISNGHLTLTRLLLEGLPGLEDTDDRNRWLYLCSWTFTTVHEAIEQLKCYQTGQMP